MRKYLISCVATEVSGNSLKINGFIPTVNNITKTGSSALKISYYPVELLADNIVIEVKDIVLSVMVMDCFTGEIVLKYNKNSQVDFANIFRHRSIHNVYNNTNSFVCIGNIDDNVFSNVTNAISRLRIIYEIDSFSCGDYYVYSLYNIEADDVKVITNILIEKLSALNIFRSSKKDITHINTGDKITISSFNFASKFNLDKESVNRIWGFLI